LDLVALLIDGIHFGGQVLVVALGIDEGGVKHVLGLWQGAPFAQSSECRVEKTIRPEKEQGGRCMRMQATSSRYEI
jgi:hypothetical protein